MNDEENIADFVDAVEELCEAHDLTVSEAIEGLSFVIANVMSQMSEGVFDPNVWTEAAAFLEHNYKYQCGLEESATITIN